MSERTEDAAARAPNATSRRSLLGASIAGVGAMLGSGLAGGGIARAQPAAMGRRRSVRIAHFTDAHIQPERDGGNAVEMCLHHIQSQKDKPELILNTGDCVFDSFARDDARTALQWDLWKRVMKSENALRVESCLGNHDIWGWDKRRSKTVGTEVNWGKQRGMEALGLAKPYHSFDVNGWHIVMLDSIVPFADDGYRAKIDDEQYDWLESDLAANKEKHTLIASHVPLFSTACVLWTSRESEGNREVVSSGSLMHLDGRRLHEMFLRSGNVRACISGHLHLIDRGEFAGVTYLSNPAVSGNWWKGKHLDRFGEMYTLLDLYDDGTFDIDYASYGWNAKVEPGDKPSPPYPPPATRPATAPSA